MGNGERKERRGGRGVGMIRIANVHRMEETGNRRKEKIKQEEKEELNKVIREEMIRRKGRK